MIMDCFLGFLICKGIVCTSTTAKIQIPSLKFKHEFLKGTIKEVFNHILQSEAAIKDDGLFKI